MARPEALVRVTLLEPYGSGPLPLRYGSESRIPLRNDPGSDADFENPELCAAFGTNPNDPRNQRGRIDYSVPVDFTLDYSTPEGRQVDVPAGCAMLHFGDWRIKPGDPRTAQRLTWAAEKMRVALHWGDYRYPRALNKGDVDLRKIAEPAMPRVMLQVLDARTHSPLEPKIYPHDHWKFGSDIDLEAVAEVKRRAQVSGATIGESKFDLAALSEADLAKLRAAILGPDAQMPIKEPAHPLKDRPRDERGRLVKA